MGRISVGSLTRAWPPDAGQAGPVPYSFYWRGCTDTHCFASGLDDYPRPTPPTKFDQHVDLLSWVALVRPGVGGVWSRNE